MEREIYEKLVEWKKDPKRKPLILDGARQVGKTWILKEFGKREYENVAYINCDKVSIVKGLFIDFDVERLIRAFSAVTNEFIIPEKTLIILDEIQEAPLGLTALKYFFEDANEYHIVVAGSLLGIRLHEGTGFPVGKVNELKMHPMSFMEFLTALGNSVLVDQIKQHKWNELSFLSSKLEDLLRQYYYVGGMPEVVCEYVDTRNLLEVRNIQNRILSEYEQDFSKHIPRSLLAKVNMVWNSIPSQLAKENKKFVYRMIKKGARAKDFEDAIQWLIDAGLVFKCFRVNKIDRPLKFYEDFSAFKLFVSDLGLLGAKVDVSAKEILTGENYFSEYKGAFTEQFVAQELHSIDMNLYYFSKENSSLEIDLIVQKEFVYPIEVKAEENLKSKSLRTVFENNPSLQTCRFSMAGYRVQDWMTNVPLYLCREWIVEAK
ncbi:MAG: ATP-binding protein [Bacillota bacterium]|nr:ATP-binding protein [Bacillota bacterium]